MRTFRCLLLCCVVGLLASCQPERPEEPMPLAMEGPIAAVPGAAATMDIGTVETTLILRGKLADRTPRENIEEDLLTGMRGATTLATYTVNAPVPRPLWLSFNVSASETYNRLVIIRGHIYRDDQPLRPVATAIGQIVPPELYPQEFMVDALEGVEALPESVLLVLKAEVFLLPEDTDPAAIDVETITAPAADTGFVMSNPVRLLFPSSEEAP